MKDDQIIANWMNKSIKWLGACLWRFKQWWGDWYPVVVILAIIILLFVSAALSFAAWSSVSSINHQLKNKHIIHVIVEDPVQIKRDDPAPLEAMPVPVEVDK